MTTKRTPPLTPRRPSAIAWHIAERDQGQMVEVAFGYDDEGDLWRRIRDRGTREITFARALDRPSESWEPWYGPPRGVTWTDDEPAPRAFRIENRATGVSLGVYRAPTKRAALRCVLADAGYPDGMAPEEVGGAENLVAIEVDVDEDEDPSK